ncbi:MAG: 1-deoxy-D-xylulose-5-phosphate synthase [Acidimicrobiales bacterium]
MEASASRRVIVPGAASPPAAASALPPAAASGSILDRIHRPADLKALSRPELDALAGEIRDFVVQAVSRTGGHLGSNLGVVELSIALHRVFESPRDLLLWDTGHQAYVHKLLTGRKEGFSSLRQEGGLSGYPNRQESPHDWVENSHASTILSYAHGLSSSLRLGPGPSVGKGEGRRVVAVVGDGALTGGMAYEALNNLGHSGSPVIIVLNDNGRSYAPTVSKLSESLTRLRLNPSYVSVRARLKTLLREVPGLGDLAYSSMAGVTSGLREIVEPHVFFEALGVRYTGPIDGHDVAGMESALANAATYDGPIVVHVLTHKGKGYAPAEDDEVACLHDLKVAPKASPGVPRPKPCSYTDAFTTAILDQAGKDPALVAITAAMPGPTGLLPFASAHPERFFDVGIAEAHAVTAAAGMAMGGLHPVVAVYASFFSRAFDQANLDVGMHRLPVTFVLDRAGVTGDDGPSHHGILDMAQCLSIPGMAVFAPSSPAEVSPMLAQALSLRAPAAIRIPKTPGPEVRPGQVGSGLSARRLREGDGSVCLLGVGKMVARAAEAAGILATAGVEATVWDVRVIRPTDQAMLQDAAAHDLVVTVEDGIRVGGAGSFLADAIAGLDTARRCPPVLSLGLPHAYMAQAKPDAILSRLGLDGPGIATSVLTTLEARVGEGALE